MLLRKGLSSKGFDVSIEELRETWHHVFRINFFNRALQSLRDCRNFYHYYQRGFAEIDSEVDCNSVVLFCRVQRMLQITSNALRMQISNTEARRLEKEIKGVLEEWSQDDQVKKKLLNGRRVELAEELRQVRTVQEKLEEFVLALNHEKS
uniref:Dynamin-like GTPase OPA1 C-terminal domain-containing protein n=1 Tax=Romanomermis culicivorax TaxID=13658 RepID=A0A915JUW2_ROMCU